MTRLEVNSVTITQDMKDEKPSKCFTLCIKKKKKQVFFPDDKVCSMKEKSRLVLIGLEKWVILLPEKMDFSHTASNLTHCAFQLWASLEEWYVCMCEQNIFIYTAFLCIFYRAAVIYGIQTYFHSDMVHTSYTNSFLLRLLQNLSRNILLHNM